MYANKGQMITLEFEHNPTVNIPMVAVRMLCVPGFQLESLGELITMKPEIRSLTPKPCPWTHARRFAGFE